MPDFTNIGDAWRLAHPEVPYESENEKLLADALCWWLKDYASLVDGEWSVDEWRKTGITKKERDTCIHA